MKKFTARQYASGLFEALSESKDKDHSTIVSNFFKILSSNRDRRKLPEIMRSLSRILSEKGLGIEIHLTTTKAFTKEHHHSLEKSITEKLATEVKLKTDVKPEILGGAIIRINDKVYDGSLQTSIYKLSKHFAS